MKRIHVWMVTILLITSIGMLGCQGVKKNFIPEGYQSEYQYNYAVDFTYLAAIDAINNLEGWDLYFSDKRSNKLQVWDTRFYELSNPDDRVVTVLFDQIGRGKTIVKLDDGSVNKPRAKDVIEAIDAKISEAPKPLPTIVPTVATTG